MKLFKINNQQTAIYEKDIIFFFTYQISIELMVLEGWSFHPPDF